MTEEEFVELVESKDPLGRKSVRHEVDGYVYFTVGELNIDRAAELIKELI